VNPLPMARPPNLNTGASTSCRQFPKLLQPVSGPVPHGLSLDDVVGDAGDVLACRRHHKVHTEPIWLAGKPCLQPPDKVATQHTHRGLHHSWMRLSIGMGSRAAHSARCAGNIHATGHRTNSQAYQTHRHNSGWPTTPWRKCHKQNMRVQQRHDS